MLLTEQLGKSIGNLCEVRTPRNDLIFVGKLHSVDEDFIAVVANNSDMLPPAIFNTDVKVNIRGGSTGLMVYAGKVGKSGKGFWFITSLQRMQSAENRNFFRQRVSARATVIRIPLDDVPDVEAYRVENEEREDHPVVARLLDISLGGILFSSEEPFVANEVVELTNVHLLQEELPFNFNCRIRRVDNSKPNTVMCGCSFEKMDAREQDRLCRVIFILQRNELRKRRQLF